MVTRLPKILAIFALIFLLGALIIQQTVKGNRERVEIIQNSNRLSENGNEARFGETRQTATAKKPKNVTDVSVTGIVADSRLPDSQDVLGESVGQISVNDAIFEELDAVPGIGPKTAEKIINGRPWTLLDDVLNLISKRYREEAREKLKL